MPSTGSDGKRSAKSCESMKTLLIGQGVQVSTVWRVISAGDAFEDGDVALCQSEQGLFEVIVKAGKVEEILKGWDSPLLK